MFDYIEILLRALEEDPSDALSRTYLVEKQQADAASDALRDSLSEDQQELFLAYEESRNSCERCLSDAYARRVFLLAREIYR